VTTIRFPKGKRGNTYGARITFTSSSGSIAECVVRVMVKSSTVDADADALISVDNDELGGVTIINAASPHVIDVDFTDTQMATLPAPKNVKIGVQLEMSDGTTEELEEVALDWLVTADVIRGVASP
jgi:hypothetical protein